MTSHWGSRLEKKLNGLADTASKESIQTIANWIIFNRKHSAVICQTLADCLSTCKTPARQWLFWQLVHELLDHKKHSDPSKWDRFVDLRAALGESTVVPALQELGNDVLKDKVQALWKEWDDGNAFASPTLLAQIERLLAAASSTPKKNLGTEQEPTKPLPDANGTNSEPPPKPAVTSPKSAVTSSKPTVTAKGDTTMPKGSTAPTDDKKDPASSTSDLMVEDKAGAQRRESMSSVREVEYDFGATVSTSS